MSLITTTLLTAACWLGGCDGSQKTQPVQNATPAPAAPTTPLTELERQAVGQWVVNITEYGKLLAETERTRDKDKPTSYVPMMGLMYAPLLTLSIAQDRTACEGSIESAKLKTWSLAKNRVLLLTDNHATEHQSEPEWVALLSNDGLLYIGTDWKVPLEKIVTTPARPISEIIVGKWMLDTASTDAYLKRHIEAYELFSTPASTDLFTPIRSLSTAQRLPEPFTIECTSSHVTMTVGSQARTWPYQIHSGLAFVQLPPDEPIYDSEGKLISPSDPDSNTNRLFKTPSIVVGQDQLRIISEAFDMFPELASLPARKQHLLTSAFFKRDTADTKTEPPAK